jgi:hypothetical protein
MNRTTTRISGYEIPAAALLRTVDASDGITDTSVLAAATRLIAQLVAGPDAQPVSLTHVEDRGAHSVYQMAVGIPAVTGGWLITAQACLATSAQEMAVATSQVIALAHQLADYPGA